MIKVHFICCPEGRKKGINIFLGRQTNQFIGVRNDKSIQIDHYRGKHIGMLSNCKALDYQVKRFLCIFCIYLYPPAIEQGKRVSLITIDIPGKSQRAVCIHHHDGETTATCIVQTFRHIKKPLG